MASEASTPSLTILAATGNRFAVHDGFLHGMLEDPGALALVLRDRDALAVDGLLQLLPVSDAGDTSDSSRSHGASGACRMVIHNIDGSRAEACGNGLRCIAKLAHERGYVQGTEFVIETDAGPRHAHVSLNGQLVERASVSMGIPRVVDLSVPIEVREGALEAAVIDLGNPHCVFFVPEITTAPVRSIGEQVEVHALFPDRTNVEFVDVRSDELRVRIWERGVGETDSSGTGVTAAAIAAIAAERTRSPVRVVTRGGELSVDWSGEEPLLGGAVDKVESEVEIRGLF